MCVFVTCSTNKKKEKRKKTDCIPLYLKSGQFKISITHLKPIPFVNSTSNWTMPLHPFFNTNLCHAQGNIC